MHYQLPVNKAMEACVEDNNLPCELGLFGAAAAVVVEAAALLGVAGATSVLLLKGALVVEGVVTTRLTRPERTV